LNCAPEFLPRCAPEKESINRKGLNLIAINQLPRVKPTMVKVKVKVKQSRYRPGVAQRVPGI
jgi:hypothetical protein